MVVREHQYSLAKDWDPAHLYVTAARLSILQLHLLTHEHFVTESQFPSYLLRSFFLWRAFIESLL